MSPPDDTIRHLLISEIRLMILPLTGMFESALSAEMFSEILGWGLSAGTDPATDQRIRRIVAVVDELEVLRDRPPQTSADVVEGLIKLRDLWAATGEVPVSPLPPGTLGRDIVEALLVHHLRLWHPIAHDVLTLLTVIQPSDQIEPGRIGDLFTRTAAVLGEEYLGPGGLSNDADAETVAGRLFPRLVSLLGNSQLHAEYGTEPPSGPLPASIADRAAGGFLWVYLQPDFDLPDRYGVTLALSPRERGGPGLLVLPWGQISDLWDPTVDLRAAADGLLVGPGGVTLLGASTGISSGLEIGGYEGQVVAADGPLRLTLRPVQPSARAPAFAIPEIIGTRLEIGEFSFSVEVSDSVASVKASARKSAIVISPADADSFVDEALRSKQMRIEFDLGVTVDTRHGFSIDGGSRLSATIAVNKSVGPITVRSVQLSLTPDGSNAGSEVRLAALASLRFGLGLLTIDIEEIGLALDAGTTTGPLPDGALAILSSLLYLDNLGFRPPSGIAVAVDSGPVTGGGFLFHDADNGQYAGVLQLEVLERASLKAVGLLSTRLPDGGTGFSFLIIASVEFDPPLGPFLGVTVLGLGIIVGVHRTIDTDALREGLRNRTLDAILFPSDPVADAARLVKAVGTMFPPARNRHLIGISAKLGFGNPPIATLELAMVWERGDSPKWVVMGQLHAALPRGAPVTILELHVDGAGIWDLDRGEFSLDARMYDSRLAFATFGGDVALRTRKSGEDSFVLFSAGGYHPEFAAPPGFPKLDRIRFALADTEHFRLVLTGYMAFTPNTKQFGAEVKLFLGAAGFSFECELGFDALFDDDLGFVIDFDLEIKIKYKGRTLLGADVWGRFTGPEPKRIKGEWSIDLWLFSVGKSFDRTFGDERPPAELPRVDPLPRLVAGLRDKHNWTAAAPPGRALVSLRTRPDEPAIAVHPLGGLAVRQAVVPLGVTIDRFAGATVPGGRRFDLTGVRIGGRPVTGARPLDELFAAADFLTLSDDEKLARPSFEAMQAGLALQPDGVTFGGQDPATASHRTASDMDFENIVFGADGGKVRDPVRGTVSATTAVLAAEFGAAARSALRITGRNRYQLPVIGPRLRRPAYVVAGLDDLTAVAIPGAERAQSFTATRQALDRHTDARSMQVVAAFQTKAIQ
jgi:hypothetical protein